MFEALCQTNTLDKFIKTGKEGKFLASTPCLIWRVNILSEAISCNQLVMKEIKRADWIFFVVVVLFVSLAP